MKTNYNLKQCCNCVHSLNGPYSTGHRLLCVEDGSGMPKSGTAAGDEIGSVKIVDEDQNAKFRIWVNEHIVDITGHCDDWKGPKMHCLDNDCEWAGTDGDCDRYDGYLLCPWCHSGVGHE